MLRILGDPYRNGDGLSRRNFLELGIPALGLTLPTILAQRAAAAETARAAGKSTPRQKSLIVFWTDGGFSQQDTYDMKPDAPAEYRGMYRPIATNAPGIQIGERLPYHAKVMDKLSIVRSVHHGNGIHAPSAHWVQTGYFGPTLARNAPQKPSFGSVISRAVGARNDAMPAYVTIPKSEAFGYQGSVYLGAAHDPFEVGTDPNSKDFKVANLSLPTGLGLETVRARRKLLEKFDNFRSDLDKKGVASGLNTFKTQALELIAGDHVRNAFDLDSEDEKLRDRYGRHQYGQSALLARRLIEAGSTCVTVNTGYWDHHDNIEQGLEELLPPFDQALGALVEDLVDRGLWDDVILYSAGEFGRTPMINGHAGRDHWSNCFSVLLGGGGFKGGTIVGASEKLGGDVADRPVTPLDVLATLYEAMGVPLDTHYEDTTGRPVSIVGGGKPISELL